MDSLPLLAGFPAALPSDLRYAVEIRHRGRLCGEFCRLPEECRTARVLADLYSMPKVDRVTTEFTIIRVLAERGDIPDDLNRVRADPEPEHTL